MKGYTQYPFGHMHPGDLLVVPAVRANSALTAARAWCGRNAPELSFRRVEDGTLKAGYVALEQYTKEIDDAE